jgi:hypothetical protein
LDWAAGQAKLFLFFFKIASLRYNPLACRGNSGVFSRVSELCGHLHENVRTFASCSYPFLSSLPALGRFSVLPVTVDLPMLQFHINTAMQCMVLCDWFLSHGMMFSRLILAVVPVSALFLLPNDCRALELSGTITK